MLMTVKEFINASERYIEEYREREFWTGGNNWASAGKRVNLAIKMIEMLGDIESIEGSPMSNTAPYIINIGDVAEMVMSELFNRANGYGRNTRLAKSCNVADIYGKSGKPYEVKFFYSRKYKCTALNPSSPAEFVYLLTSEAVYKIPFSIALASEKVYSSKKKKYRCICLENIPNLESYILKTYTESLFG